MDILYSDSLSRKVQFNCLMFMPEISNRMLFVNGKHAQALQFDLFLKEMLSNVRRITLVITTVVKSHGHSQFVL